jgi:hypothetical protein
MVVSPMNVVSSAPCAQPSRSAVFGLFAFEQSVDESGGKAVAAAHAIDHVQLGRRRDMGLAVDPRHRAPTVPVGGVHFAQRGRHDLHMRMFLDHVVDHAEEDARDRASTSHERRGRECRVPSARSSSLPISTSTFLTIDAMVSTAFSAPPEIFHSFSRKLRSNDVMAPAPWPLHHLRNQRRGSRRERRKDAARVHPAHAAREDLLPVEIAGFSIAPASLARL